MLYFHVESVKIFILLSILNDAPIPFHQILPSISHETTISSFQILYGVFQLQNSLILLDIMLCKGNYFQRKRKRGHGLFYIVCRKIDSLLDIPYSQKNMGMLSRTCRLVLSRTLRIITMTTSLKRLFINIKKGKTDNFSKFKR